MISKKGKTLIISIVLTLIMTVGVTMAFLVDSSDAVVNTFNPNKVKVDLTETGDGKYEIIPGTEQFKDPKVILDASIDSYVFLIVEDTANTEEKTLVNYAIIDGAEGWQPVDKNRLKELDVNADGKIDLRLDSTMQVYYRVVSSSNEPQEFYILKDNKVSYDKKLKNEDMPADNVRLAFRAYALQKEPFNDPVSAWNQSVQED